MRILAVSNFYPPDVVGGYELGCSQMAGALRARGHTVRVVTSTPRVPVGTEDAAAVARVLRIDETANPLLRPGDWRPAAMRSFLVDPHNVELLRREVEAFAPEVVYVWNVTGVGGVAVLLAVELSGLPWVAHLMDAVPLRTTALETPWDARLAALLTRALEGTWVACSQGLLDEIAGGGATLRGRVTVLRNWVTGPPPARRDSWFAGDRTLRCLYAGRLAWDKGVHIAVEAVGRLVAEGCDVRLDIAGDGPERAGLESLRGRLGLDGRVDLLGALPQAGVLGLMEECDVLLFPTEAREPFGFVALEAAARGCVPVATAGCGITEWLADGVHLLASPRSVDGVAAVLRAIVAGEVELAPLGRRAQAVVAQDFRIDGVAAAVEEELAAAAAVAKPRTSWDDIGRMARIGETVAYRLLTMGG